VGCAPAKTQVARFGHPRFVFGHGYADWVALSRDASRYTRSRPCPAGPVTPRATAGTARRCGTVQIVLPPYPVARCLARISCASPGPSLRPPLSIGVVMAPMLRIQCGAKRSRTVAG
jgi:hypothetical protein